jgi:thioredoxin 1
MAKSFSDIINGSQPVLVDFFAEWCGPCKTMAPVLQQLKAELGDGVIILKVDVDKNPEAAMVYRVQGVPTLILFQDGNVLWRQSGVVSAAALRQIILQNTTKNTNA